MNKIYLFSVFTLSFLYSCSLTNSTKLRANKPIFGKLNSSQNINSLYPEDIAQMNQLQSLEETINTNNSDVLEIAIEPIEDLASLDNDFPIEKIKAINLDNACDRITFLDGKEEDVKLIEIGDNYLKYKRCDNLDGPIFNVSKSKVFMIVYSNGTKEVIHHKEIEEKQNYQEQTKQNSNQYNYSSDREVNGFAIASFVFGILGFIPLLGIILGIIANRQISKNPNKFKGRGFAMAGIALSFLWIFIFLLLL